MAMGNILGVLWNGKPVEELDPMEKKAMDEYRRNAVRYPYGDGNVYGSYGLSSGSSGPADSAVDAPYNGLDSNHWRLKSIAMRMRWTEGMLPPYQKLDTALTGEKVLVWVVVKDESVVLEDERDLFPSDTLITQLRLLLP